MPTIRCAKCGSITNTACSNHLFPVRADGQANECYAKFEDGKWVRGCSFNGADSLIKQVVATLFKDSSAKDIYELIE
jgi:hypothetical protein